MAKEGVNNLPGQALKIFPVPDAYLNMVGESIGYRFGKIGDALFEGQNRPYGALISFYLPPGIPQPPKMAKATFYNVSGELVKTMEIKVKPGVNRFAWNLSRNGVRLPAQSAPKKSNLPPSGKAVPPGTYKLHLSLGEFKDDISFTVLKDPLLPIQRPKPRKKKR